MEKLIFIRVGPTGQYKNVKACITNTGDFF